MKKVEARIRNVCMNFPMAVRSAFPLFADAKTLYNSNFAYWEGLSIFSCATWQGTYMQDLNSLGNSDPLFVNATAGDITGNE